MGLAPRYRENSALSEHETKPDGFGLGEREDSPPQECPGWDVLTPRATRASKKKKPLPKFPAKVISWLEIHPSPLCLNLYLPLGLDLILFLLSVVRSP